MNQTFKGIVRQGKVRLDNKESFDLWVDQFEGKRVEVIVKKYRRKRTTGRADEKGNQNGYYWSIVLPISSKSLGYTVDEIHEIFLSEFAPHVYKDFGDKKIIVKVRSSQMDTVQFMEYLNLIQIKMAEMGVIIPDPNQIQ